RTLAVSKSEAEKLLQNYFKTFPKISDFLDGAARDAERRGYAQTLLGRRLDLSKADLAPHQKERIAKNMPIQGTSADMTKLALVNFWQACGKELSRSTGLVNAVHDELVVECKEDNAEMVAKHLR